MTDELELPVAATLGATSAAPPLDAAPLAAAPLAAAPDAAPLDAAAGTGAAAATDPARGDGSLLSLLDRLTGLLERSDLTELEVEAGATSLVLRKSSALVALAGPALAAAGPGYAPGAVGPGHALAAAGPGNAPGPGTAPLPSTSSEAGATDGVATHPAVRAPLTGIYYSAPAPGSEPYVQVGTEIVVGQVIGLIEAMKLFNEIKSDLSGRVVRVVAETGQLVKAKQPLIEVEPL